MDDIGIVVHLRVPDVEEVEVTRTVLEVEVEAIADGVGAGTLRHALRCL